MSGIMHAVRQSQSHSIHPVQGFVLPVVSRIPFSWCAAAGGHLIIQSSVRHLISPPVPGGEEETSA
jgi:hypothetical protein